MILPGGALGHRRRPRKRVGTDKKGVSPSGKLESTLIRGVTPEAAWGKHSQDARGPPRAGDGFHGAERPPKHVACDALLRGVGGGGAAALSSGHRARRPTAP